VPVYLPLVVYIFVAAVSTRWHYLIDLPAGLALAFVCVKLAEWLLPNDPEPQHIAA
jgi:hypothetical protein